jgi:hypothetical protein
LNGTSHLTSVLLDKGTVREALRAVVRSEMGLTLPPRQQTAYTAIQALLADGTRLYITPQLLHILQRPANLPIARVLLPELSPLIAGRYLRRWARRLREAGISREDALVVSYASFGVDEQMEIFGVATVLTTDARLKAHYMSIFDQLTRRFRRMTSQLKAPYRDAHLPTLVTPEELVPLLST